MRKIFIFLFLLCGALEARTHVLVSIAPQKFLVERIGGEHVSVDVIVPAGANSHTYEPTLNQMLSAQKGEIWFRIGEGFEARLLASLKKTRIVDQRDDIDLITAGCGCCSRDAHDPHIWLSPRLLKIQAAQITRELNAYDPEHRELFQVNLAALEKQLDLLDLECTTLLAPLSQRTLLISHPAFGYFCRDYNLEQLSIEMEGREPTPRYLTTLIQRARHYKIKRVFLQQQHNPKGGTRIAEEIGAETVYIDPYVEDVVENLRNIAKLFANS